VSPYRIGSDLINRSLVRLEIEGCGLSCKICYLLVAVPHGHEGRETADEVADADVWLP
jgi:hypothetical protein